jgi:ribosome-associated protein
MDMGKRSSICTAFVLMSAPSSVRVKAIVDGIDTEMEEAGLRVMHKEGYQDGVWVLMDYGDVIVHVFHQEKREFYDIENLWGDVPKRKLLSPETTA